MKHAIGIDIGGTKISMVVGNAHGKILARREITTRTRTKTAVCLRELVSELHALIRESSVKRKSLLGIGVAVPGPVDSRKGIVPRSPHLPGWKGLRLAAYLKKKFALPVTLANDANAAAMGEKIFGRAKKAQDFIYMTVSTGVGGGLVAGGRLIEGASCVAGEVGHLVVQPKGEKCGCGHRGCLEAYASGTAIARFVAAEIKRGRSAGSLGRTPTAKRTARVIGHAAKNGNALALRAFQRAGEYLGCGIASLLNVLNPEWVILGGGVLKSAPPVFLRSMRTACKRNAWPEAWRRVKIVRTQLGDHVGNLGALALVFDSKK